MECIIGYIGLQSCASQEVPESGQYINTLPGITLESIDKIANADQVSYAGVWRDVQIEASIRFKADFIEALSKCYTINRNCDYEDMICSNLEFLAIAWRYLLGFQLMIERINSTRLNRFTTLGIEDAEKLAAYYWDEYKTSLAAAIKLVDVSDCCQTECSNNPQKVIWLP